MRDAHTALPYRPKECREYYERVSVSDLNRFFEAAAVPWRLDNGGETADRLFETEWWNLYQVLAWVYLGDRGLVREGAVMRESAGFAMRLIVEPEKQTGRCYPSFSQAQEAIIEALQTCKLIAYGLENGGGDLKEIPAVLWADLKFWWDPDHAGLRDCFRLGASPWVAFRIKRKDILALWPDPLELLVMADEQLVVKADRAHSEEQARMPNMDLLDLSHSKFIPLSVLGRTLERDKYLIEKALHILSVDHESTYTEFSAVSGLLNHWLVNRELDYYINGQRGDDITALTVIPVNGDYGKGLAAMEAWITIDKQELIGLLISRNLKVPGFLLKPPDGQAPAAEEPAATAASHNTAAAAANPFAAMDGLAWAEITMTFIGLDSVRVKALGRNETFTFDAMGFKLRTSHIPKPNECWKTFLHLAIVRTSKKTWNDLPRTPDLKKRISRLREQLRRFFGIAADPIAYKKGEYQAAFNLTLEEQVIQRARERYADCADEDTEDDIQRVMSEPPGWSR